MILRGGIPSRRSSQIPLIVGRPTRSAARGSLVLERYISPVKTNSLSPQSAGLSFWTCQKVTGVNPQRSECCGHRLNRQLLMGLASRASSLAPTGAEPKFVPNRFPVYHLRLQTQTGSSDRFMPPAGATSLMSNPIWSMAGRSFLTSEADMRKRFPLLGKATAVDTLKAFYGVSRIVSPTMTTSFKDPVHKP